MAHWGPEIYEEPFSRQKDYEVTLTFSDFAPLDRIPFEQAAANRGRLKLRAVIDLCMKKSGINTGALQTFITTTSGTGASLLDGVCGRRRSLAGYPAVGAYRIRPSTYPGCPVQIQLSMNTPLRRLGGRMRLRPYPPPKKKKVCNHCTLLCNHCTLLCNRCTLSWPADQGTHIFAP